MLIRNTFKTEKLDFVIKMYEWRAKEYMSHVFERCEWDPFKMSNVLLSNFRKTEKLGESEPD